MANPTGKWVLDPVHSIFRPLDSSGKFRGYRFTAHAGSLASRELDEATRVQRVIAGKMLADARTGRTAATHWSIAAAIVFGSLDEYDGCRRRRSACGTIRRYLDRRRQSRSWAVQLHRARSTIFRRIARSKTKTFCSCRLVRPWTRPVHGPDRPAASCSTSIRA